MNLELYINNRLCDIESPEKLGIRLKRVFINPSELNTKDAQKSYEISLPATPANNEIFNYVNVEEVQGKFRIYGDARLYVDGVLILDGKFRLSEITKDYYKGNLGVPAPVTVKDIFGETNMNQAGTWQIPFRGVESITDYNTGSYPKDLYGDTSPCIFPLVLYGLLPKVPDENGNYTGKDKLDKTVRFGLENFPPSVNVAHLLRKIFSEKGYTLTGNALEDERLNKLYVSYRNPGDYEMPVLPQPLEIAGSWQVLDKESNIDKSYSYGHYVEDYNELLSHCNILHGSNLKVSRKDDPGLNIVEDNGKYTIRASHTGLYKLTFEVEKIELINEGPHEPPVYIFQCNFDQRMFEIKVVRNYSSGDDVSYDNYFFAKNRRREQDGVGAIYPPPGNVNFVDPAQNKNMVCGFAWGKGHRQDLHWRTCNPAVTEGNYCNPMAITGGRSWDGSISDRAYSATPSATYLKRQADNSLVISDKADFLVEMDNAEARATMASDKLSGNGIINQVIWLEKGDTLSIITVSDAPTYEGAPSWYNHSVDFRLRLEPFRPERSWLTINTEGASINKMDFADEPRFGSKDIDLIKFLPADIKVNDWIDNFCKAFNLRLGSRDENTFELSMKTSDIPQSTAGLIDLDAKTSLMQRTNEPLRLPAVFDLGFTIDTAEEGYYESMDDKTDSNGDKVKDPATAETGGGRHVTGSKETSEIKQTSSFSYNWYKDLTRDDGSEIRVPVISDREVWEHDHDYAEMQDKTYYDKAQRFWYPFGTFPQNIGHYPDVQVAVVSSSLEGNRRLVLNYEDKADSILRSFFLLLADNDNDYTLVDCHLTPDEYERANRVLAKLNGDLYHIAEIDGYDPLDTGKCTLKLIRKII